METRHNLSPGSAGMGWWVWRVDVSCVWPYNCILSGLGSERMFPFPEVGHYCSLWISVWKIREHMWWRGSVPGYLWFFLSLSLAVEILSEMSVCREGCQKKDAEKLSEAAETVFSCLSSSREKGWELESSPCGLWLDTPQETRRAQQPHWKSHLLQRSKHETVLKRRK